MLLLAVVGLVMKTLCLVLDGFVSGGRVIKGRGLLRGEGCFALRSFVGDA